MELHEYSDMDATDLKCRLDRKEVTPAEVREAALAAISTSTRTSVPPSVLHSTHHRRIPHPVLSAEFRSRSKISCALRRG